MNKSDEELSRVVKIIKNTIDPQRILLFGSRATKKFNDMSDYDLCVLVKDTQNTREREKQLYYILASEGVGIAVDLIVEPLEKYERLMDNPFLIYYQVKKYGKTIYER
jgi:predicted nucleotidyltransferase